MIKLVLIGAALMLLAGCEQQYRYLCHDPANWEDSRCKKPICEINKDCPEYILKGVYTNGNSIPGNNAPAPVAPVQQCIPIQQKGVCK